MTSAGQAAAMALRLHSSPQKSQQQQPQQRTAAQTQYARAQSLTSGRSNSMRQYTYNPKPSYVPGNASIPNARRYNSLTSASRVNYNSNVPTSPLQHQYTQIHEEMKVLMKRKSSSPQLPRKLLTHKVELPHSQQRRSKLYLMGLIS